jgi:hypothetical protein
MTGQLTHARIAPLLAARKTLKADPEDDREDDEQSAVDDDDVSDDDDDDASDDPEENDEEDSDDDGRDDVAPERPRRARRGARVPSGMGRPSTGPAPRPASERDVVTAAASVETEIVPDISSWPGTTEAARMVGRHTSTIKLWRAQGRIRATQDGSGCWRHHPDDLAEAIDTPDSTDPGSVLASGMSAIVAQGASASERLLRMTELSTNGLKDATQVLSEELKRAYDRIALLEEKLAILRDKHAATHADDLKHERFIRRLDQRHELEIAGAQETSARLSGLLVILGPIAASIGARLLGKTALGDAIDASIAAGSAGAGAVPPPSAATASPSVDANTSKLQEPPPLDLSARSDGAPSAPAVVSSSLIHSQLPETVSIETRIADAMGRLSVVIRLLDKPAFAGLRAMLPPEVARALDDIARNENDSVVGRALAVIVRAAQNLSDLQFMALRPIAPSDVTAILSELRELLRRDV